MDARSDAELARAWRGGDASAFDELYARYHEWVATLAFRFTRNREDALDVLQETFSYLVRKRPNFELQSQMKTFLYPVIKNLSLSRLQAARRQGPRGRVPDPEAPRDVPDEAASLLEGLSEVQQEVVLLRFVDGMDYQAIADALGVPLGTVKTRLHSALGLLRDRIPPNR